MVEGLTFSPISTAAVPSFFDVQFMGETCGQSWQNSWLVLGGIPIMCFEIYKIFYNLQVLHSDLVWTHK